MLIHWYICLCVCISAIKPIIDVQRKPSWQGPMLMWTSFLHLGVYLMAQLTSIWKVVFRTVKKCDSHKLSLSSQFVICRNLWWRPWRGILIPIILRTCYRCLGEYPCKTFDMNLKSFIFADSGVISLVHLFVCISVIMTINDVPRKLSWKDLLSMWTCFLYLGVHHRALLTSICEVVFWNVTICGSHKLRQVRNYYRRNLWFVAIRDQDCAVVNSVK